jgi:hypothetical protein
MGVIAICILGFIGAALLIWGGLNLLFLPPNLGAAPGAWANGILIMALGAAVMPALYALYMMRRWGMKAVLALEAISLALDIVSFSIGMTTAIPVVIIAYLWISRGLFK